MSKQEEKISQLIEKRAECRLGGGEKAIEKQHQRGKYTARERIAMLLDEGSFEELDMFVTHRCTNFGQDKKHILGDGVVTGFGTIEGRLVYVFAQDFTVFGGSLSETMSQKICKVMDMAMKMGAPVIGLVDCAGLRLQEATDALDGFGQMYLSQTMASGVIPQITAVFGVCGGGMAVSAAITDFTFMEEKKGKLFVNSPNALDHNYTAKCDTASAKFQSEDAGMVDYVGDEASIMSEIRTLVSILPANNEDDMSYEECTDDLNRVCEGLEGCVGDTALALKLVSDDNFFMELKKMYAPEMVTGFIRLNGTTVGCVANRTEEYADGEKTASYDAVLTANGCAKAADFVNFCDAFNIPLLTLVNVKGYKAVCLCQCHCSQGNGSCGTGFWQRVPDHGQQVPWGGCGLRLAGRFHRHDGRDCGGEDYVCGRDWGIGQCRCIDCPEGSCLRGKAVQRRGCGKERLCG